MDSLAHLITALATLIWPVVIAVLLFKLIDPLRMLVESARGRKFTVKVGGNELTMEQASEQQGITLIDLQTKVADLEKRLASSAGAALSAPTALAADTPPSGKRILWVDDEPKNNSYLVAVLEDRGARVDIAFSSDEALGKIKRNHYDIILSDMTRPEGKRAGPDLAHKLRQLDNHTPFYIFCGNWAAQHLREEALAAGVTDITASGTTLLSLLPL